MNQTRIIQAIGVLASTFALPLSLLATANISGVALENVNGVANGDYAVMLVKTNGQAIEVTDLPTLVEGADLSLSSTYAGFEVIDTTNAFTFSGLKVEFNIPALEVLNQPVVTGDSFGVLTFTGTSTTAIVGTSYEIWTDATWLVPNDEGAYTFDVDFTPKLDGSTAGSTGTVTPVPEPSSFAAIAGCLGLAWVMARRRV